MFAHDVESLNAVSRPNPASREDSHPCKPQIILGNLTCCACSDDRDADSALHTYAGTGPTGPEGPTGAAEPGGFAVEWKQDPGTGEWVKYDTARAFCPNLNRNQCKGKTDLGNGIDASVECKWVGGKCTYVVNHCEDNTKKTQVHPSI